MAVHSQDEALMCRVFPSSLGPIPMRWFDGLRTNSISSFKKLTQSFYSRFITCSRVPQPLDSLLSMSMREGESVKAYSKRYWEMFNKIDGDFNEVAIKTFKVGLPFEYDLRKSLTGKMMRNPEKRNHNLYFQYHQDHRHNTENCRSLWDHLDQLVREGKLKQLLHHSSGQGNQASSESWRDILSKPPLRTINVIFAAPGRTRSCPSRVMSVARLSSGDINQDLKRARVELPLVMGFSD